MAALYRGDPGAEGHSGLFRRLVLQAFEEFQERANWSDLGRHGHDLSDLFYWEHRMGIWGAASNNVMDVAMPTLIGMNSRPLFQAAFGLPAAERHTKTLQIDLVAAYDPALARFPVSDHPPIKVSSAVERLAAVARKALG